MVGTAGTSGRAGLQAAATRLIPNDSAGKSPSGPSRPAASSARTRRAIAVGSRRSTWSTIDGDSTVRGLTQLTSRPASVSSSANWLTPKQRVIVPSGQGMSTTSALARSVRCAQRCCSASIAIPSTRESTLASRRPPGLSTRVISAARSSVISCRDSAPSSAITPSAQPSARKARLPASATTGTTAPGLALAGRACCGSAAAAATTRITVCPRSAACTEALA